nr:o-methyltransferase bik3 [Quercus suber]
MEAHPERGRRWAGAMNAFAATIPLEGLLSSFDWTSFGEATIVDVGGAWGPVSIGLAQQFPKCRFIVQDLPDVVAEGPNNIPTELRDRIEFMPYNILEPQPVKGAAIYFFRAIFHNWPDNNCVQILRNQIPALKRGARLVINDSCLHEPNSLPATLEKKRRSMDLDMLTYFGSREKSIADWKAILEEADPRFLLRDAIKPTHDINYVLDVEWRGD